MDLAYRMSVGMGGIGTAGDIVARLQMTKQMKLKQAKEFVAKKLDVDLFTLHDTLQIHDIRTELEIGSVTALPGKAKGIECKARIAELFDLKINSVERLKNKLSLNI
jgi:dimethylamine--corrinoid protein Co-methyltransferase